MVKMTFTLDEGTVAALNEAAEWKQISKSQALREAIRAYRLRSAPVPDRLSDTERKRILRVLDEMAKRPPTRPQREVDREIEEIRSARRSGGRLHPAD
jgi:hypothetical protein